MGSKLSIVFCGHPIESDTNLAGIPDWHGGQKAQKSKPTKAGSRAGAEDRTEPVHTNARGPHSLPVRMDCIGLAALDLETSAPDVGSIQPPSTPEGSVAAQSPESPTRMRYILPKPVDLELVRLKVINMLVAQRAEATRNQLQKKVPLRLLTNDDDDYTTTSYLPPTPVASALHSGAAADEHFLRAHHKLLLQEPLEVHPCCVAAQCAEKARNMAHRREQEDIVRGLTPTSRYAPHSLKVGSECCPRSMYVAHTYPSHPSPQNEPNENSFAKSHRYPYFLPPH